jgi:hypothetical protein
MNSVLNSGSDEQIIDYGTSEEFLSWLDGLDWGSPSPILEFGLNSTS